MGDSRVFRKMPLLRLERTGWNDFDMEAEVSVHLKRGGRKLGKTKIVWPDLDGAEEHASRMADRNFLVGRDGVSAGDDALYESLAQFGLIRRRACARLLSDTVISDRAFKRFEDSFNNGRKASLVLLREGPMTLRETRSRKPCEVRLRRQKPLHAQPHIVSRSAVKVANGFRHSFSTELAAGCGLAFGISQLMSLSTLASVLALVLGATLGTMTRLLD